MMNDGLVLGLQSRYVPIINVSPEAYGLPSVMDAMAPYVSREGGGGLGDILRGIFVGLYKIGIDGFYLGPNYKGIFKKNSGLTYDEYVRKVHSTKGGNVMLLSSPHFSYLKKIYDGDTAYSAAIMQDLAIPQIKEINGLHGGRSIVHEHDQSAGIIAAYCKSRGIPVLHTLHNLLEYIIPYRFYRDADLTDGDWGIKQYLFDTSSNSRKIYSHATSVKNADLVSCVGKRFLEEILEGRFDNWDIFKNSWALINEIKIKAEYGQLRVVMNGIAPEELPENQEYLPEPFGPGTKDIVGAKKRNLISFQERMGLNKDPEAILIYWPSRMEQSQKNIESYLKNIVRILNTNPDVQSAFVADDLINNNKKYEHEIAQMQQYVPKGSLAHHTFDKRLSNLGYASASKVDGASSYEPYGMFWLQGICAGALGMGPENGGAMDILQELDISRNYGNGFLFKYPDEKGVGYGQDKSISALRQLKSNHGLYNETLRRVMISGRNDFSLDKMIEGYMMLYEELGMKANLFTDEYKHFIPQSI